MDNEDSSDDDEDSDHSLQSASESGRLDVVQRILRSRCRDVNERDGTLRTPLEVALQYGKTQES